MELALIFFLIYVVIAVIIGIVSSRRESEEDFMIADRKVKGIQLAATFSATFFDGYILSIYTAYVYQYGLSALSAFIGLAINSFPRLFSSVNKNPTLRWAVLFERSCVKCIYLDSENI